MALVLGGGGARGVAHVGVLRVLEEARVPIDLVVGTSMGAVVGALYAAGASPAEMEAWLEGFDWDALFSDSPPYAELSFRQKRRVRDYPIGLELGVDAGGVRLPSGLITGQKLTTTLRHLLLEASPVRDFDRLAIPLRVVATDLETGEPVVLGGGDLVGAIRASMSAPGVFTPWPLDGRLLADGGLTANLPVEVARELGADVIIAVDVGTPLAGQEELGTVVALTRQVATLLTQSGARAQREELDGNDILIRPDLGGHRATDFAGSLSVVAMGERAARAAWPRLRALAAPPSSYAAWQRRVRAFDRLPERIDFVALDSRSLPFGNTVRRLRARSGPLDTVAIRRDLQELYSHGIYEAVDYELSTTPQGTVLQYTTREKAWGPNYLRFRLGLSDDLEGAGSYNVAAHLLVPTLNAWGGELVLEAALGSERSSAIEWFQPLGFYSRVFVAPYARYDRVPVEQFDGGRSVARLAVEATRAGLAAGLHLGNDGELRMGIEHGVVETEPLTAPPDVEPTSTRLGGVFAQLTVDGLDDPFFPRRGYVAAARVDAERPALGADADYDRVALDVIGVASLGAPRLLLGLSGAASFGDPLPFYRRAGPGGPLVLSGYRAGEISGNHLLLARSILFAELRPDLFLALSFEAGNAWDARSAIDPSDLQTGGTLSFGARTPLGPAYLGYGVGEGGRRQAFLVIGRGL